MRSNLVESIVYIWNCLYCVQPVEFIISSAKTLRKRIVCWEVLVLQLKFLWFAASVVHVIGSINCWPYINSLLWVLVTVAVLHMELSFLLVLAVLWVRINSFVLEFLLNDFALDESFGFFEIIHGSDNLGVTRDDVSTDVCLLCPYSVLNPNWTVLIVGSLIKVVSGAGRKYATLCIIHCYVNFIFKRITFY